MLEKVCKQAHINKLLKKNGSSLFLGFDHHHFRAWSGGTLPLRLINNLTHSELCEQFRSSRGLATIYVRTHVRISKIYVKKIHLFTYL